MLQVAHSVLQLCAVEFADCRGDTSFHSVPQSPDPNACHTIALAAPLGRAFEDACLAWRTTSILVGHT